MSSKVSKSDRAKSKFAQSNINHVYKGNSSEPQHKPAVRQYGMQVVGKLQGTRRLPPPAWVPSIKAESGGLDTRVALVPPGGSGWGAPSGSPSTGGIGSFPSVSVAPSEVVGLAVTATMNGSVTRDSIGSTFEPAFARPGFETASVSTNGSTHELLKSNKDSSNPTEVGTTAEQDTNISARSFTDSSRQPANWSSRTQPSTLVGGLAANKPFFQRPAPVASSQPIANTDATSAKASTNSENNDITVEAHSGWAAITEEPDFDERILFSDEETEPTQQNQHTSAQVSEHLPSTTTVPITSAPPKSLILTAPALSAKGSTLSSEMSHRNSTAWSVIDVDSIGKQQLRTTNTFGLPNVPANCKSVADNSLLNAQYHSLPMHPPGPSIAFQDSYFAHQLNLERRPSIGTPTGSTDYLLTGDSELHAQRQARTQEFKSAVERAQQARTAHLKSDSTYQPDGESFQHSSVNSMFEVSDGKFTSTVPPHTASTPSLPYAVQQLFNNFLPPYQAVPGQTRPDFAAAVAAATAAAAVAYGGANVSRSSSSHTAISPKTMPSAISTLLPSSSCAASMPAVSRQPGSSFVSVTGPSSFVPHDCNSQLRAQTAFHGAISVGSGSPSQVQSTASHSNAVFLNPDFFVERFLEILNQQQQQVVRTQSQSQTVSGENNVIQKPTPTSITDNVVSVPQPTMHLEPSSSSRERAMSEIDRYNAAVDELSTQVSSALKMNIDSISQVNHTRLSESISSANLDAQSSFDSHSYKSISKRVPGLMDVKVSSSTTQRLAHIWEQDDYLSDTTSRSNGHIRARGRGFAHGSMRGRRFPADRPRTSRTADDVTGNESERPVRSSTDQKREWDYSSVTATNNGKTDTFSTTGSRTNQSESHHHGQHEKLLDVCVDSDHLSKDERSATKEKQSKRIGFNKERPVFSKHAAVSITNQHQRELFDEYAENEEYHGHSYPDYYRRADRSRRVRGGFQFTHARAYHNEDGAQSGRYASTVDQKYYSRGGFSSRPYYQHSSSNQDQRKRSQKHTDRGRTETFRHGSRSGYQPVDGSFCDRNQTDRSATHTDDARRYPTYPRRSGASGQFSSNADYYDEQHFSDGDYTSTAERKHTADRYHPSSKYRNRSQEGSQFSRKGVSSVDDSEGMINKSHTSHEQTDDYTVDAEPVVRGKTASPVVNFHDAAQGEDNDIPTVRIPAPENTFRASQGSYSFCRGARSNPFSRGPGSRRGSGRTNGSQQNKRSGGSQVEPSRRYRDQRDRHRDGKDGDGGASAGGTGRSIGGSVGGNGTSSTPGAADNSGASDQQKKGNNRGTSGQTDDGQTEDFSAIPCVFDSASGSTRCMISKTVLTSVHDNRNENNTGSSYRSYVNTDPPGRSTRGAYNKSGRSGIRSSGIYSASGRNDIGMQRTYRSGGPSSYYTFSRSKHSSHHSHIPPLMSITPQGPFATNPRRFDAILDSMPDNETTGEALADQTVIIAKENESVEPSLDDADDESAPSDGFTKVVSKASKRLAKRRLQQEMSAASKSNHSRWEVERHVATDVQQQSQCQRKIDATRFPTSKLEVVSAAVRGRSRLSYHKATFMGPPLSMTQMIPVPIVSSSAAISECSTSVAVSSSASVTTRTTDCSLKLAVQVSGRTWSKVVGTKSTHTTSSESHCVTPPVDITDSTSLNVENCSSLPSTTSTAVTVGEPDRPYTSLKPFWSTETVDDKLSIETKLSCPETSSECASTLIASPSAPSTTSTTPMSISNNICKVRPQQQSINIVSNISPNRTSVPPLSAFGSANVIADAVQSTMLTTGELTVIENNQSDCEYRSNVRRSHVNEVTPRSAISGSNLGLHASWAVNSQLPSTSIGYAGVKNCHQNVPVDGSLGPCWPTPALLETPTAIHSLNTTGSTHQQYSQLQPSEVFSSLLTGSAFNSLPTESSVKPHGNSSMNSRNRGYSVHTLFPNDSYPHGAYESVLSELGKQPSIPPNLPQNHHLPFSSMGNSGGSMYVTHQQQASVPQSQQAHALSVSLSLAAPPHQSHLSQSIAAQQRYRHRLPHQLDSSCGGFPYPSEFQQSEYAFHQSGTANVPLTSGLHPSLQGQSHSNYVQPSSKPVATPSGPYPWSVLGPTTGGTVNLQSSNQDYNAALESAIPGGNTTSGLLHPHVPIPQVPYNIYLPYPPPTSSSGSNFVGQNYVGVIGGGRPGAHLSGTSRQRAVHRQAVYAPQSLSYSPSAHSHQFQLPSDFYPSISPSHQRVPIQQFAGSQGRPMGISNPATGLYAAAFGNPAHPSNQATPPPMSSQLYPA